MKTLGGRRTWAFSPRHIVDVILAKHDATTGGRRFNALRATGSINDAIEYYAMFDAVQTGRQLRGERRPMDVY